MIVVITGAEGLVGTVLRAGLGGEFRLRLLTRTEQAFASTVVDLDTLDGLVRAFSGADAIVHLAAAATLDAGWDEVLASNIVGVRHVFEAARLAGVPRVVFASSGHVIGLAEERAGATLYDLGDPRVFDEHTPAEPDSLYGVSKVFAESLGRHYAEVHGLTVACVRLGTVLADDNPCSANAGRGRSAGMAAGERFPRLRAKWLSHRDCCQLFACCLRANLPRFSILYGTSNNPRQIWSLRSARQLTGFAPQDRAPESPPE